MAVHEGPSGRARKDQDGGLSPSVRRRSRREAGGDLGSAGARPGGRHRRKGGDPPRLSDDRQAIRGDSFREGESHPRSLRKGLVRDVRGRLRGDTLAGRAVARSHGSEDGQPPGMPGRPAGALASLSSGEWRGGRERDQCGDGAGQRAALRRRQDAARRGQAAGGSPPPAPPSIGCGRLWPRFGSFARWAG